MEKADKMKVLIVDNGRKFFFKGNDLHTQFGFLKKEAVEKAKPGTVLETNTGRKMTVLEAGFNDIYSRITRGAQIIPMKDIGTIISVTGVNKNSTVLDAGSGSGALCLYLAHICKKVYTYEIREDFFNVVRKNIAYMGAKNIVQKNADIYLGIKEKNLDLITLDLPEPWNAIPHAGKALKVGGYLMSYSPTLPQTSDFCEALRKDERFFYMSTIEVIQREWEIDGRKIRPRSQPIGHSGFLSFARRIR